MSLLITEITKYIIVLLMLIYVTEALLAFRVRDPYSLRNLCIRQSVWMFAIHALFFAQIIANTGRVSYLVYYLAQLIILTATPAVFTRLYPSVNRPIINNMCMLLMIGTTIILRVDPNKALKQLAIIAASIAAGLFVTWLVGRVKDLERFTYLYAGVGLAALLVVLLLGSMTYGSYISYSVMGVTFQPSEFVKILFIFFVASAFYKSTEFVNVAITSAIAAAHVLVLVLSKDLGGAMIFFAVYIVMVFVATKNPAYPIVGLALGAIGAVVAYRLFGHVQTRVMVWLDPWTTIDNQGYQIAQSLFGISGGGWFGMGLFNGLPTTIPFVEEDLVFSAISEEMGVLFALLMLVVCVATFLMFLSEAYRARDEWQRLIALGIGTTYLFQVFLTVGGGTKFIPLTGVTLPLVSYGGSSVMATIMSFCLFEGVCGLREPVAEKKPRGEQRSVAIPVVGVLFSVLFVCMGVYIGWYSHHYRRTLMSNSYNRRQELYMKSVRRGSIYAADGTLLAGTTIDEGGAQVRQYPFGDVFAHAVGYAVQDKSGVEAYANYDLLHSNATLMDKTDLAGAGQLFPGDDVVTTLDVNLQRRIYEAMGAYRGAVIVTDPKTGEILAMVSKPSFDPATVEMNWTAYTEDKEAGILLNRASQGLYPAGSTFKIVTTLAYLRDKGGAYQDYSYNCYGSFSTAGETVHCFNSIAHGQIDLTRSFALSCNSSFVNIGVATDRGTLSKTLKNLHFGADLPCDLIYNRSATADPLTCDIPDIMQLSIGQGQTAMTPLHMNMITAAVANKGELMRPHVIGRVADVYGRTVKEYKATSAGRLMSEAEATALTGMMREVVTSGTGVAIANRWYEAAGKTGSAEHRNTAGAAIDDAHAWFTGFAPASDPQVCVTLILEDAGSSSSYAVPLAGAVFDAYFETR